MFVTGGPPVLGEEAYPNASSPASPFGPDSSLLPDRVKAFDDRAGASGTISDLTPCYRRRAADVQFFDVVGSRSKRSGCASDDEADARRQKRPARS
jgi:hypothetical protein